MELGVCYYPEHWPTKWWADDARQMAALGIRWVRIAEFAWSRFEPSPGKFDWGWLDQAIETLAGAGLKIVMGTPTNSPPKWLVDEMPDMLARGPDGQVRGFGSRRHYCFSHQGYRKHSRRITTALAQRYGQHPAVAAWQTDNEFGCHDTTLSYSTHALQGFRRWLQTRYGDIAALNRAWGAVFWSQEYRHFDEIELPNLTVTEANPSQRLDFQRYSSAQVQSFQREQCDILRRLSPGRPVTHNYMGFYVEFDHHAVSQHMDIATWDSYPLGFTQNFFLSPEEKMQWARTGHPDIAAFHHDLYRGMCPSRSASAPAHGRWWVMEQQPGPVNWAQWNPAPLDGMVRLWTWQAFAHGAEVVSYFRWRQAPFAQEQQHAGLNRPDRTLDQGGIEARQVGEELQRLFGSKQGHASDDGNVMNAVRNQVAMVFDYDSLWMTQIQPQGKDYHALELAFRLYSCLRQLGLDVDIVSPQAPLQGYRLVVLPFQMQAHPALCQQLEKLAQQPQAQLLFAPRAGSKTSELHIPPTLAPGGFAKLLGLTVQRVSSLPPGFVHAGSWQGKPLQITRWMEDLALHGAAVEAALDDGRPLLTRHGNTWYAAGWLDLHGWQRLLQQLAQRAGLLTAHAQALPNGLRVSRAGDWLIALNFSSQPLAWQPEGHCERLLGQSPIAPQDLCLWRVHP